MLRIATRKSLLAMWQARHVRDLLQSAHPDLVVELVPMVTRGDRILDQPLAAIGGKGLFLKELEQALLDGRADLAVHSMKDVPADMAPGLAMPAVLERADHRDALVCREAPSLAGLPPGALVGTSSLRRQAQLLASRPDLKVADLRGNVDTRLGKLAAGDYDAVILACAGLDRLGLDTHITERLDAPAWLPAATQGIIGLQCREGDAATQRLIAPLDHHPTHLQAIAERRVALRLEASCQLPIAVYARHGPSMRLYGLVGMPDGSELVRAEVDGDPEQGPELGDRLAAGLLEQGAGRIISALN